jgi:hypothetical protein
MRMGREIEATIRWQGLAAKGRAILEGAEIVLRAAGFIDTKSCAVSDDLTATRYKLRG